MDVHYHICDHCKKRLDEMKDYHDSTIDICYNYIACDLCADCVEKLTALVRKFVKDGDKGG